MSKRTNAGRKFAVVKMAVILLLIGMGLGVFAGVRKIELPWLSVVLPIIAGVLPAYITANLVQKKIDGRDKDVS